MLNLILYLIVFITATLGFSGVLGVASAGMLTLFHVSLVLLVLSMLTRGFRRNVMLY